GTTKTTDGPFIFNDLTVTGSYTLTSGSFSINNTFYNSGSLSAGSNMSTFSGNFTNAGAMSSDGITVFSGTKAQTIQLIGTLSSTAAGIVYFNGSVAPVLNSNSAPSFVSVIINNTAGISPSIDWTVYGLFKINSGAAFNGGSSTHTFYGNFINEGTVTSGGVLNFMPTEARTLTLGSTFTNTGTVRFGGSGLISLTSSPVNLATIEIANINPAGITPPVSWLIAGDLNIKTNAILNAGNGLSHIVSGFLGNEGTLNGYSSTFSFNSMPSLIEGTGTTNFYNLVISDSTTISSNVNIKGNFTNNSVLTIDNIPVYFNGISSQSIGGSATTNFYDLLIDNSTAPISALENLNISNSFSLGTGSVFKPESTVVVNNGSAEGTLSGTGTIEVTRTLLPADYTDQYKFATYDLSKLTVKFSGNSAQTSSLTSFYNLTVDNTAGFTLSAPTTVSGTLRLEDGNITTNGNILTVGTSIANTGAVEIIGTGMVLGKLKRWVAATSGTDIVFPVGNSNTRRKATIRFTTAPSGGTLNAEFIPTNPGTAGIPLTEPNGTSEDILVNTLGSSGYWTIAAGTLGEEALTGGTYNATLEATNFAGINNLQNLVMVKRSNNTQSWALNGTHVTASGTSASPIISRTGLSGFSDFAFGGTELTTLPVELISFTATKQGFNALLTWKTAIEINNQGFYIEVSPDGKVYHSLGFIPSNDSNSRSVQTYQFIDKEIGKYGTRYYRIKQVDIDEKTTYFGPKVLTFKEASQLISVYPNPFTNKVAALVYTEENETGTLTLSGINGNNCWEGNEKLRPGKNQIALPDFEKLAKGIYFLKIVLSQTNQTIKLVKE
ncbi:MAG: hypothetical protein JWN41_1814, partial [Thermoleophilia bacterium]|nr:hypothetical protein [Thermoleophilia bacterium]